MLMWILYAGLRLYFAPHRGRMRPVLGRRGAVIAGDFYLSGREDFSVVTALNQNARRARQSHCENRIADDAALRE
jgi:hypothetical protein